MFDKVSHRMSTTRLGTQLDFLREIDKLKGILRRTYLNDGSRHENSAEHSWHLALMAVILQEHAAERVDLSKVIRLLLVHDIVEIDAGDTFCYDEVGNRDKVKREQKAADRIFCLLPDDQSAEVRQLWDEFEEKSTPEARFANALDRMQPLLHNSATRGGSWREHGITRRQVEERNHVIGDGSPQLWSFAMSLLDEAEEEGYLRS